MTKNSLTRISNSLDFKVTFEKRTKNLDNFKKDLSKPIISKEDFFRLIQTLDEVETESEKIFESGVDLSMFESKYLEVIETLLSTLYNSVQINLIHIYLYGEPLDDNISLPVYKDGKELIPESKEELWIAIHSVS